MTSPRMLAPQVPKFEVRAKSVLTTPPILFVPGNDLKIHRPQITVLTMGCLTTRVAVNLIAVGGTCLKR